jgi:hypothetical protein
MTIDPIILYMSLLPLWEEIENVAPDPATLERCYPLASRRSIKDLGVCGTCIWGKIKSSGASFYQVCWQLKSFTAASNAPIYPKPDKYALALAYYYCKNTTAFPSFGEVPQWVTSYIEKASQYEPKNAEKEKERQFLREKNQLKRQAEMLQGCLVLTIWIEDCLRMGLARLREQPFSFWESIISKLNDYKLNGIASRLLPLFKLRQNEHWIKIATKQLGEVIMFVEAFQKWDDFNPLNQQDLLIYGGATLKKEMVLLEQPVYDSWFVSSIAYREINPDLHARFIWLYGPNSKKFAQFIDYRWQGEPWDIAYPLFTYVKGNMHFYPSGFPQRAILQSSEEALPERASCLPEGYKDWHTFFEEYRKAYKSNFLVEAFPGIMHQLTVEPGEDFYLIDHMGVKVVISPDFEEKWEILAFSQTQPIAIFGLWDGLYFTPKSYSAAFID